MPNVAQVPVEIQGILISRGYISLKLSRNFYPWFAKSQTRLKRLSMHALYDNKIH